MSDSNQKKIAAELYKRGGDSLNRQEYDYAVENLLKCVKLDPENLIYRQALRGAEYRKYKNNGAGATMASAKMMGARTKASIARTRKKWTDLLENAEDGLFHNPWDFNSLLDVALGLHELEKHEGAYWAAQLAVKQNDKSAEAYRLYGNICEKLKKFIEASRAWEKVKTLDPKDSEAQTRAHHLAAQATIQKGGYEEENDQQKIVPKTGVTTVNAETGLSTTATAADTVESRVKRDISSLEAKQKADPTNTPLIVELADLYRRHDLFDKAIELYQGAIKTTSGDSSDLTLRLLETTMLHGRRKLEQVKEAVDKLDKKAPDAAAKFSVLKRTFETSKTDLWKREVDFFKARTQLKNEDYEAHFELGKRMLQVKQIDDAIKAFQQSRNDMKKKTESLCLLGECFWAKKNFALAERNLNDALSAVGEGDGEMKKRILYSLGRIAEDRNEKQSSIDRYNEIAAMDYGYRDVAQRLDRLNAELAG